MSLSERYKRPVSYDNDVYEWHLGRVPETVVVGGQHVENPAFTHAIFVVHGMGVQKWAETAALLRSGFEDALEDIQNNTAKELCPAEETPPLFIYEGFWADYDNLEKTFPEEWARLDGTKRDFFAMLWKKRSLSILRTFGWFLHQQLKLLNPTVIWNISLFAWLLYIPLQVVSLFTLLVLLIRYPKVISQVLSDVRLYVSPKGVIERAIVQRIDKRVGDAFLKMIGINWDFELLPDGEKIQCNGKGVEFDHVVWVAHSLGSVVSYNVLSDLFRRAKEIENNAGARPEQKAGVKRFRTVLQRFVTIGSPLDKIAFLTGKDSLRPFPGESRKNLLDGGETLKGSEKSKDWWVNFYHVLDPVSGALSNPLICSTQAPINYHIKLIKIPGVAHISYWTDKITLRYILSRGYGEKFLHVPAEKPYSPTTLTALAVAGYIIWMSIIVFFVILIFCIFSKMFQDIHIGILDDVLDCMAMIVKSIIALFK